VGELAMSDLLEVVKKDEQLALTKCHAHNEEAARFNSRHYRLGMATVVLTSVVGTAVFASIATQPQYVPLQVLTGVLSVAAAAIAALHTFFDFAGQSAKHKAAGGAFEVLRRRLELLKLKIQGDPPLGSF
jgi:hypothetical protein